MKKIESCFPCKQLCTRMLHLILRKILIAKEEVTRKKRLTYSVQFCYN